MTHPASRRLAIPLLVLAAAGLAIYGGEHLYGVSDWGAAANAPVNPVIIWNACLTAKPTALNSARPGIDPRSHLYYRPLAASATTDRVLTGWLFYGSVTDTARTTSFACSTDPRGTTVTWLIDGQAPTPPTPTRAP